MSYSFNVRAATVTAALEQIAAELDKVVASQPIHAKDRDQAFNAVKAFARLLPENTDGHDVVVSMHGSVGTDGSENITGAGVGVSAHLEKAEAKKEEPATVPTEKPKAAEEPKQEAGPAPEPKPAAEQDKAGE